MVARDIIDGINVPFAAPHFPGANQTCMRWIGSSENCGSRPDHLDGSRHESTSGPLYAHRYAPIAPIEVLSLAFDESRQRNASTS
jgi:hypothetical protein